MNVFLVMRRSFFVKEEFSYLWAKFFGHDRDDVNSIGGKGSRDEMDEPDGLSRFQGNYD